MLPITGTFLDEITHDIPSQNWGPEERRREYALKQTGRPRSRGKFPNR